jgi:hypothetical protein
VSKMPATVEAIADMPWSDMCQLMAAQLVTELADMKRIGSAEAVLQERISRLSDGERRVLRRAVALQPPA